MVGGSEVVVASGSDEDVGGETLVLGAGREVLLVLLGVLSSGGLSIG